MISCFTYHTIKLSVLILIPNSRNCHYKQLCTFIHSSAYGSKWGNIHSNEISKLVGLSFTMDFKGKVKIVIQKYWSPSFSNSLVLLPINILPSASKF